MTVEELREKILRHGNAAIFGGQTEEEIREVAEALSDAYGVQIGRYLAREYTNYPYLFYDDSLSIPTIEGWASERPYTISREDALEILAPKVDVNINAMDVL